MEDKKGIDNKKFIFTNISLVILFIISIIYFVFILFDKNISIINLISSLIITLFTIVFIVISITYKRNSKKLLLISSLLLIVFFGMGIYNYNNSSYDTVPNFQNKSISYVMKWANKNKIHVSQEYEYSDMVEEYKVISQNIESGSKLDNVKDITISISEGANPSKEIMVPNMNTWDSERVINFINDNHMNNILVEFVESEEKEDTVIEQDKSGNLKRNDEIKLTFSSGEELGFDEVRLIDFKNKSRFEVMFYMKKNHLNYEFHDEFSNKIKRGLAIKSNITSGEMVKINDKVIEVFFSKGSKVKVIDLVNKSSEEVINWAINNKLKINFSDKYDDSIKNGYVISTNYSKGDIIEQGTVLKVVLSRGTLKMPSFKSLDDFYKWVNKYDIKYEEEHEFNSDKKAGEVIKYSKNKGEIIKNDEVIKVTISDGEETSVPNLKGLSKKEAKDKLDKLSLKYSFIYKNSKEKKDIVIDQSISSGSKISNGTSISITLSNGKVEEKREDASSKEKNSSVNNTNNKNTTNSNINNNNNNNNISNDTNTNNTITNNNNIKEEEEVKCNPCTITGIKGIISTNIDNGYNAVSSALISSIQSQCPGIKVNISADDSSGKRSGNFISGFNGGNTDSCSSITIVLAK